MKSQLHRLINKNKIEERQHAENRQAEIDHPKTPANRRDFLKRTALGGMALTGLMGYSLEDNLSQATSKVNRNSAPSELVGLRDLFGFQKLREKNIPRDKSIPDGPMPPRPTSGIGSTNTPIASCPWP
jgi:hypothetical protein